MADSVFVVGKAQKHENVSFNDGNRVFIRVGAYTVDNELSVLPPEGTSGEPQLLAISGSVANGVECLVDTGASISMFRSEIAEELGLDPNSGEIDDSEIGVFGGGGVSCCRCIHEIYLEIGPYPIAVRVRFPVKPVSTGKYEWYRGLISENVLGMESLLGRRILCFTPRFLIAFENSP